MKSNDRKKLWANSEFGILNLVAELTDLLGLDQKVCFYKVFLYEEGVRHNELFLGGALQTQLQWNQLFERGLELFV